MSIANNPYVKTELDALEIQFGKVAQLTLKDYAELYRIDPKYASQHARRRGIPMGKEGKDLYFNVLDLAVYKAQCKYGHDTILKSKVIYGSDEMKRRRGFSIETDEKRLAIYAAQ